MVEVVKRADARDRAEGKGAAFFLSAEKERMRCYGKMDTTGARTVALLCDWSGSMGFGPMAAGGGRPSVCHPHWDGTNTGGKKETEVCTRGAVYV